MSKNGYKLTTANLREKPLSKDEHRSRSLEGMADKMLRQGFPKGTTVTARKTKKQKKNWWKSLTSEEQDRVIKRRVAAKTARNMKKNEKLMEKLKLSFDCKKCIHGIINSCTDRPKGGCVYFADEVNEVYGPKVA